MSSELVRHNIIIFGESGSGKSSVVNMLVGRTVADVTSSPFGCTFDNASYDAQIAGTGYHIYDTAGLNETEQGRVPHYQAIANLYTLVRKLDGVSLLIYCMRGRIKENTRANWTLFNDIICGGNVPIIAVVTGVENDKDWDTDEKVEKMKKALREVEARPKDLAFVVPIKGKHGEFTKLYERSQSKLYELVKASHREPWSEDKNHWFATIYRNAHGTRFYQCLFPKRKHHFDKVVENTHMAPDEAGQLRHILLDAEEKFRAEEKENMTY